MKVGTKEMTPMDMADSFRLMVFTLECFKILSLKDMASFITMMAGSTKEIFLTIGITDGAITMRLMGIAIKVILRKEKRLALEFKFTRTDQDTKAFLRMGNAMEKELKSL